MKLTSTAYRTSIDIREIPGKGPLKLGTGFLASEIADECVRKFGGYITAMASWIWYHGPTDDTTVEVRILWEKL